MSLNEIRILYVDDDEDDFLLVQSFLRKVKRSTFVINWVASYDEALQKINDEYDIFLVDYRLGKETGLELLRAIKKQKKFAPVIMLTGMENGEVDSQAMMEGAADYLVKGNFNSDTLERTIRYAIRDAMLLQTMEISTNRFRNIFERATDPIILIDKNGFITKSNPAFVSRFGYNPDDTLTQLSFLSLFAYSQQSLLVEKILRNEKELIDFEAELKLTNNEQIDSLISIVKHDSMTNVFQVMIKDLSAIRIKEEETRSLKKFSSTGRIARIMAHEVKNPLTNITLSADQLRMELPETILKDTGDLIDIIHRNCSRINQLVSELLNSTRFTELQIDKHSMNELIEEALELAKDRISLKKIKVEKKFSYDICDIEVDAEKVKIAFLNLIVNAVEAMEPENGALSISTAAKDKKCVVEISDNGTGIANEHLDHLFEPFFTSKEKGTGLGLTNTQNIILSHKGFIRVKSEPGKGTTFIVSFALS